MHLDLLCSLLMEAGRDRRRGFAGPGEFVVENLTFAGALRIGEETMTVLGGGAEAHGEEEELSLGSRGSLRSPPRSTKSGERLPELHEYAQSPVAESRMLSASSEQPCCHFPSLLVGEG